MSGYSKASSYTVEQGDCILSIAAEAGLAPDALWSRNSSLSDADRKTHTLLPGDHSTLPALEEKVDPGATNARHRFEVRGRPALLKLRLLDMGEPLSGYDYTLDIDGSERIGTTDGNGTLEEKIPPSAKHGELSLQKAERSLSLTLELGVIDPIVCTSGVQGRLANLGYNVGPLDGQLGPRTASAIRLFQTDRGLQPAGEIDDALRERLKDDYGG